MELFVIILPLIFQIIFGRKAIGKDIQLSFGSVCLISFFSQIVLTIFAFKLTAYHLKKNNIFCGMPLVGLIVMSLFFSIILFITMLIQERIKKSYDED